MRAARRQPQSGARGPAPSRVGRLLVSIPNKGTFVKEFTCKDIDEIFDMRVLLEGYGIRNSRANLTSTHIQRLLDILEDLQTMIDAGDLDAYARVDEQLHNEIVSLGNNSIVSSAYYRVGSMNQQFRVLSLNIRQRFEESQDEHRQVIHAIIRATPSWPRASTAGIWSWPAPASRSQLEKKK